MSIAKRQPKSELIAQCKKKLMALVTDFRHRRKIVLYRWLGTAWIVIVGHERIEVAVRCAILIGHVRKELAESESQARRNPVRGFPIGVVG